MTKRWFYILVMSLFLGICGCGTHDMIPTNNAGTEAETEQVQLDEEAEDERSEEVKLWQEDRKAATVLEDAEFLYFCASDHILKVDKETFETEKIWETQKYTENSEGFVYSGARGILAAGRIYFIEKWAEEEGSLSMRALSAIDTSGKNYEQIELIPAEKEERLVLLDGVVYFCREENGTTMEGYALSEDGRLLKREKVETVFPDWGAEYVETYYYENGSRVLSALESGKKYGYYLLRNDNYELCRVDLVTGEKLNFPANLNGYTLSALNDDSLLFVDYAENKLYLADAKTLESRYLTDTGDYCNVIGMDDKWVYYQTELFGEDFYQYQYYRTELVSGESEELFTLDVFDGTEVTSPWYAMDVSVLNGYIYYVGEQDYKLYLMRRNLEMPNAEEILGEPFYDSKISAVGVLETFKEKIYSKNDPDVVSGELNLERLVVDEKYAGAEKINSQLEKEQQGSAEYLRGNALDYDEWAEYDMPGFSFTSRVSPIYYMDGGYLSFVQENYDYTGGAHGMPDWIAHTFDLVTGDELTLSEIVVNDEVEVKEIVTRYFAEQYNKSPDDYWADAVEIVNENVSLQSPFYLSERGIVFYYGPYSLAPYAGGFKEIVVPYSEFDMKINIE